MIELKKVFLGNCFSRDIRGDCKLEPAKAFAILLVHRTWSQFRVEWNVATSNLLSVVSETLCIHICVRVYIYMLCTTCVYVSDKIFPFKTIYFFLDC